MEAVEIYHENQKTFERKKFAVVVEPPIHQYFKNCNQKETYVDFRVNIVFLKELDYVPTLGTTDVHTQHTGEAEFKDLENNFYRLPVPKYYSTMKVEVNDVLVIKFIRTRQYDDAYGISLQYLFLPNDVSKEKFDWTYPIRFQYDNSTRLTIVGEKENVLVTDNSVFDKFSTYGDELVKRFKLWCPICMEHATHPVVYSCGHAMCMLHHRKIKSTTNECSLCRNTLNVFAIAKVRDSHCPIDCCDCEDDDREKVCFLYPCGCVLPHCDIESAKKRSYCPYELCRQRISEVYELFKEAGSDS